MGLALHSSWHYTHRLPFFAFLFALAVHFFCTTSCSTFYAKILIVEMPPDNSLFLFVYEKCHGRILLSLVSHGFQKTKSECLQIEIKLYRTWGLQLKDQLQINWL